MSNTITCEQLTEYLNGANILVNNVFVAKSKFENSKSFRVNINESDVSRFTSSELWAPNIIIRDWVFKGPPKTTRTVTAS